MYYLGIFVLILFIFFLSISGIPKEQNSRFFLFIYLVLFLTSGCRYEVGSDYFSYKEMYEQTLPLNEVIRWGSFSTDRKAEIGYMFISSIFRTFGCEINVMYLFISLITTYLFLKSIWLYNPKWFYLCVLTYFSFVFFVIDMSAVRQSISLAIYLYSIRYIHNRNIWMYFLLVILASLFHFSALVLFPFYWLLRHQWSDKILYISIGIATVICTLEVKFIELILTQCAGYLFGGIGYKLAVYGVESQSEWGMNPKVVLEVILFLLYVRNKSNLQKKLPYGGIILNMFFFYMLCRLLLWESIDMSSRFGYYFVGGIFLGLPLLVDLYKTKFNRSLCLIFIILFNFYQSQTWLLENTSTITYNPYQNYVIHRMFDLKDTGEERFKLHRNLNSNN